MSRRVHTAQDVLGLARGGATELVIAPKDLLTPLARDVASEYGVRIVVGAASRSAVGPRGQPPTKTLRHVRGASTMELAPFPVDLHRPEMDVRLSDVLTAADGLPIAAGMMSLRQGSFPWTLDYDEVDYVIEGELHITADEQRVVGRPGDVIGVPKGSSVIFGTPSWARFLYVTYPADWGGGS